MFSPETGPSGPGNGAHQGYPNTASKKETHHGIPEPIASIAILQPLQRPRPRRRLAVVDACNGNLAEAARLTYLPWTTLRDWKRQQQDKPLASADGSTPSDLIPVYLETKLARLLEEKIEMMVAAITPERLEACSLPQIIVSLNTVLDRVHALRTVETAAHHLCTKLINDDRHRLGEILRRHISDRQSLRAILMEMDEYSEESNDEESNETENDTPVSEAEGEIAVETRGDEVEATPSEADSGPCPRHPSTAAGEPGTREAGGGVRVMPSEAEVAPAPNSPSPSEERAVWERGGEVIRKFAPANPAKFRRKL